MCVPFWCTHAINVPYMCLCVRVCACACACGVQITGALAEVLKGTEAITDAVRAMLTHQYSLPEMFGVRTVVFVEANNPNYAATIMKEAEAWAQEKGVPLVCYGEWKRLTPGDALQGGSLTVRPGVAADTTERRVGVASTNATKWAGAMQLRSTLEAGTLRFSRQFKVPGKGVMQSDSAAITSFMSKMESQLGAFKYEKTRTGLTKLSGKHGGANDDIVVGLMFFDLLVKVGAV